ncbi:glutamine--fructose-6-phosphate transaminase (isomerizing) [Calditerrivibrio nitroreducens]|uniref:Glutamine--fructose-6-phosphate aminotransferase [isomerizing] n=1 Tax=Calditerrivibrio nitroreducens (strain DSM 19672 / NBRC 101217 / Yu37-1) TaxID=768670 RepID=E4TEJ7_CALNY|nr:glutamine--fructose-6-phosphate transaminase (isomerizing) [Calditerrivibrio nitroreducens]ADR18323.1 glutamine--fructose-6-phosphate transaminase [Calditerrivibrio nitroreducens DSM 19672]
MCGIVGYIGDKNATDVLIDGLTRLEYRGYDSAGIALIIGNDIVVERSVGKLVNLKTKIADKKLYANIGIGHTRWATHGKPSDENAHPHRSGDIVIVHNGIIENYLELKRDLIAKGYQFSSETDTEVIAHLLQDLWTSDLFKTVQNVVKKLKGAYALAIVSTREPDKILLARKEAPLVIGIGEGENFAASDIPAVLHHTRRFIFLEDYDVAILRKDSVEIFDKDGKSVERQVRYISWNPVMAEKAGYKHFMQKEIYEQPRAITDTIRGKYSLDDGMVYLTELEAIEDRLKVIERIQIVACGTSWHAGLVGKFLIEKFAKIPVEVDIASEYRYRNPIVDGKVLFIPISQSGETADTLAALRLAKSMGAVVVSICNVIGSSITRESDGTIYTHAGPEIGVASTKAFTTQLATLYLLGIYLAQLKGTLDKDERLRYIDALIKVPEDISSVLTLDEKIEELAKKFKESRNFLYLGRNINYPVALEGALKLKEISYIHAEGYPAGEMKHGPIALIDKNMPVFFIATDSHIYEKTLSNIEEVKARDGVVIAVATEGNNEILKKADYVIYVKKTVEETSIFTTTVVAQFFAYHCATLLGLDVDQPRNLAKSVTVE